jgi:hypothetical protein
MLQAWFTDTGHPAGKDPYFLYAASNLGSMLSLVAYPAIVESHLTLSQQAWAWSIGFGVLMALTLGCAAILWTSRRSLAVAGLGGVSSTEVPLAAETAPQREEARALEAPTNWTRFRWLALAFVPSSLMMGATTFITTDVASVPLLWIIPLALYLLTFVIVFAHWPTWLSRRIERNGRLRGSKWLAMAVDPHWWFVWLQPILIAGLVAVFFDSGVHGMKCLVLLHLGTFFATAMVCHGELARSRPSAQYLTEFYIWMSLGGVVGGLFNGVVAPVLFGPMVPMQFRGIVEYPLVIVVACLLRPGIVTWLRGPFDLLVDGASGIFADPKSREIGRKAFAILVDISLGVAIATSILYATRESIDKWHYTAGLERFLREYVFKDVSVTTRHIVLLAGGLAALLVQLRPVRFAAAVATVLLAGHFWYGDVEGSIYTERSFYGVMRVRESADEVQDPVTKTQIEVTTHTLMHGSTNHGEQIRDPQWQRRPITYYASAAFSPVPVEDDCWSGPIGQTFDEIINPEVHREIGIVGLGTGTTASLRKPGQRFTYFEIDPYVVKIAKNNDLFSYLRDSDPQIDTPQASIRIELGDARLTMERMPDNHFDLLLIDAFSSDSIPMHLITKEAIGLYFQKLKKDGILLVHISNRHLNLRPVVGNVARSLGVHARCCDDENDWRIAKFASQVVILVRNQDRLGSLLQDKFWKEIKEEPKVGVWTDDFSNILTVLRWFED